MPVQIQRFSGSTIDDAVASATEALGHEIEIIHARRVRRGGLLGFFANEHVEVTARTATALPTGPIPSGRTLSIDELAQLPPPPTVVAPPPPAKPGRRRAQSGEEFDQYLARLVEEVDRREGRLAAAGIAAESGRRFTDEDLVPLAPDAPEPPEPVLAAAPVEPAIAPAPAASAPPVGGRDGHDLDEPVMTTIDLRRRHIGGPAWSHENLRRLGVPDAIVDAVYVEPDSNDMTWTLAVERALRCVLPPPASAYTVAMHGYGLEAAITLIDAAMHGYPIGDLHLPDRLAKVTTFELALAIRGLLCR